MRQRKPAPSRVGPQLEIRPVGEKMLEWGTCPREAGPPFPRLSSPGERERNAVVAIRVGVNMLQFCSVSNSLSHTTLSIKWEVYFSKDRCPLVFIVSLLWFCMLLDMSMQQNEILLPRYTNLSINFKGLPFNEKMTPSWWKHRDQRLLLPAPGYAAKILPEKMDVQEAFGYLHERSWYST